MYTHCPNCDTHFEISQEYLDIANGKVRCGKCDHIFNALDNLYENGTKSVDSSKIPSHFGSNKTAIDKLSQLQDKLSSNINNLSTDTQSAETMESLINSNANSDQKPSVENTNITTPGSDIKEKMERIAASLAAATAELKSARKSTSFHRPQSSKTDFAALFPTDSTQLNKTGNFIKPDEPTKPEAVEGIEASIQPEPVDVIEETIQPEPVKVTEDIIQPEPVDVIEEIIPPEELEIIEEAIEPEDELDLVDFKTNELDNSTLSPTIEHNTRQIDDGDMDILNSLIEGEEQRPSNDALLDELDDINKTLSDSNDSLDDEFSNLGGEFDDLDNGDDLLAELEQLESEFLHGNKTSSTHSNKNEQEKNEEQFNANIEDASGYDESTQETKKESLPVAPYKDFHDEVVPSFLTQNDSSSTHPAALLGWLAGTIGLLVLLSIQYLHVNSIQFSQNTNVRPLLETLCPITNCSLPLIKAPRKIITVSHDVRSHPKVNNALEIQLIFKNKAKYTQGYPLLEITFSNPLGEVIARRKFMPDEYLTGDIQYAHGLKANQSQEINLKIIDPDPGSLLSFQFNYL